MESLGVGGVIGSVEGGRRMGARVEEAEEVVVRRLRGYETEVKGGSFVVGINGEICGKC